MNKKISKIIFLSLFAFLSFQSVPNKKNDPKIAMLLTDIEKATTTQQQLKLCKEALAYLEKYPIEDSTRLFVDNEYRGLYLNQENISLAKKEEYLTKEYNLHKGNKIWEKEYFISILNFAINSENINLIERYLPQTIQILKEQKDDTTTYQILSVVSQNYYYKGDYITADEYLSQAIQIENRITDSNKVIELYSYKTDLDRNLGNITTALKSALIYLNKVQEKKEPLLDEYSIAYNNLASIYSLLKDHQNAIKYYKKAIDIQLELGEEDILNLPYIYNNIVPTYITVGKYNEALNYSLKSIEIASQFALDDEYLMEDLLVSYSNTADIYRYKKQNDSSFFYLEKAKNLMATSGSNIRQEELLMNYSEYYASNRQFIKAQDYLLKALDIYKKKYEESIQHLQWVNIYNHLTENTLHLEDTLLAKEYIEKSLMGGIINYTPYQDSLSFELKDIASYHIFSSLITKIELYSQGNTKDIQIAYNWSLQAITLLEQLNRELKNKASKRDLLDTYVLPFFETNVSLALQLADIYPKQKNNYLEAAFVATERSKSILSTGEIQEKIALKEGNIPLSVIQTEEFLYQKLKTIRKLRLDALGIKDNKKIKEVDNTILQLELELEKLKVDLEQKYPDYYTLKYKQTKVSLPSIQKKIANDACLVSYFEGQKDLYAFWIKKDAIHVTKKTIPQEYNKQLTKFSEVLSNYQLAINSPIFSYQKTTTYAHKYFQLFIDSTQINSIQRLIIIPDGLIAYVPFEVFLKQKAPIIEEGEKPLYSDLDFLLKDINISYDYSASTWALNQEKKTAKNKLKILGIAASYEQKDVQGLRSSQEALIRKSLQDLPGALKEVKILESKFSGDFLYQNEASEKNIKKNIADYQVIHFAAHGVLNKENPEYSSLALTEDNDSLEDNFLYAYELAEMGLNPEFVVLSACESGIGKYQRGEGVMSLGRTFMNANIPSIMMTLWSLNDHVGALIMEDFYEKIKSGMDKDEALRKAKLDFLEKAEGIAQHPAFWACYIQLGNHNAIEIESNSYIYPILIFIFVLLGILVIFFKKKKNK